MDIFFSSLIAYILGSIPFALLLSKLIGQDVREIGSGNIGTANAFRTGNKLIGVLTLIGDIGKAVLAVLIAKYVFPGTEIYAAFFSVIGHIYSCFLKFKGGKGVATAIGGYFMLNPMFGLVAIFTWLSFSLTLRYSSLASMMAVSAVALYAFFTTTIFYAIFLLAIAILIIYCHKENIQRLLNGNERKINF